MKKRNSGSAFPGECGVWSSTLVEREAKHKQTIGKSNFWLLSCCEQNKMEWCVRMNRGPQTNLLWPQHKPDTKLQGLSGRNQNKWGRRKKRLILTILYYAGTITLLFYSWKNHLRQCMTEKKF